MTTGSLSVCGPWDGRPAYRPDLLELAFGHLPRLPRVLGPTEPAGHTQTGILLGPGTGDNMAAALGVGARPGDVIVSVGRRRPGSLLRGRAHPQRPHATAHLSGLRLATTTPANLARAAVEGMLCGLADGLDALRRQGVAVGQVLLIGGGARSRAVQAVAPSLFDAPVLVPPAGEYVADGAARQAAWLLSGDPEPPSGGRPCPHEPSKHHQHPTSTRPTPPPATSAPEPQRRSLRRPATKSSCLVAGGVLADEDYQTKPGGCLAVRQDLALPVGAPHHRAKEHTDHG